MGLTSPRYLTQLPRGTLNRCDGQLFVLATSASIFLLPLFFAANGAVCWVVRVIDSSSIYFLGSGLYSWFNKYSQDCLKTADCQARGFELLYFQELQYRGACTDSNKTNSICNEGCGESLKSWCVTKPSKHPLLLSDRHTRTYKLESDQPDIATSVFHHGNLPPIPNVFVEFSEENYGASTLASFLADLHYASQTGNHHNSWGLTIFRTVFTPESAETFPLAVKRIDNYLRNRLDVLISRTRSHSINFEAKDELVARLFNTVIEDAALDGASMETVEQAFHDWVEENGDLESDNPRYRFALVLDQEGIDETLRLPDTSEKPSLESYRASCKGPTRWCLDQRMSCQWFWAAPAAMPRVMMFSLDDCDKGPLFFTMKPISDNGPVFETTTVLNRLDRNCNKLTGYQRTERTMLGQPILTRQRQS